MGYVRLFRRVRIAPGVTLNVAKHGPSVSFGVRGAHVTVGRSGIRKTAGIPGTGVFYTTHDGWHSGIHSAPVFHEGKPANVTPAEAIAIVILALVMLLIVLAILGAIFAR